MSSFLQLDDLDYFQPFAGLKAKVIHGANQTCSFWEIEKDAQLPRHQHPHEQMTIVTSGSLELTVGNETQIMLPGMVAIIPSNTDHEARAITDVKVTDVFYPVREDFR